MECGHFGELCIKLKKLQVKDYRIEHQPYCNQYFESHLTHSNLNFILRFWENFLQNAYSLSLKQQQQQQQQKERERLLF